MARLLVYIFGLLLALWVFRRLSRALLGLTAQPRVRTWSWGTRPGARSSPPTARGETARDPVCGMFVSTELSEQLVSAGKTLHFCSRRCLERYQKTNATR